MGSGPGAKSALHSLYQIGTLRRAMLDKGLRKHFQQLISSKQVLTNIPPEEIDYLAGDEGEYEARLAMRKMPWLLKNIPMKLNRQHQIL